jgi:tetratricopeptide (TPR) repeat protein
MAYQKPEKAENSLEQDVMLKIMAVKSNFRKSKDRQIAFERFLRDYYEHLHDSQNTTQEYLARSLTALHRSLDQPDLVEPELLVHYITEIVRFVGDVGLGSEFTEKFVDRAMQVYHQAGYSLTELYLLKAKYLPVNGIEHSEREKVFLEARRYAEDTGTREDQVLVLLELAEYYTVVSQYKKSIALCHECEQLIESDNSLQQYFPLVLTDLGMNYFCLLDLTRSKEYFLKTEALLQLERNDYQERNQRSLGKRVLSNALHYLGRIAYLRNDLALAMQYYVEAHRYQQLGLDDAGAIAFYHLRMGELLLQALLVNQARDHLHTCQEIIHATIVAGTAHIQLQLAWATLYEIEGNYVRARESIAEALKKARENNTSRMELLCLRKLLQLEARHCHLYGIGYAAFQILKTGQNGELRKNGLVSFIKTLEPLKMLPHFFYNFLHTKIHQKHILKVCTCPIHLPQSTTTLMQ